MNNAVGVTILDTFKKLLEKIQRLLLGNSLFLKQLLKIEVNVFENQVDFFVIHVLFREQYR